MVIQCPRAKLCQLFIKYKIFSGLKAHSAHCGDSEKTRANSGAVYPRRQRSGPWRWSVHLQDRSRVCCLQQRLSQGEPWSQTYQLCVTDAKLLLSNKLADWFHFSNIFFCPLSCQCPNSLPILFRLGIFPYNNFLILTQPT